MHSTFTWLDYSEKDRRRALDVIDLFRETGTVDELGIGPIRDAFSDLFFPGTSTIQTRACYFILLPWTFLRLERLPSVISAKAAARSRQEELYLNSVLRSGEDTKGVFGSSAGDALKRLPSAAYWGGLGSWGIRLFKGHMDAYFRSLDGFRRRQEIHKHAPSDAHGRRPAPANWHPRLPAPPKDFPNSATVKLRHGDARYLRECILSHHPGSLLAELANRADRADLQSKWPWELDGVVESTTLREQLRHSRLFSNAVLGAALVYNIMLAERRGKQDWLDRHQERFEDWAKEMDLTGDDLSSWDLEDVWQIARETGHRLSQPVRNFVDRWVGILAKSTDFRKLREDPSVRSLIQARERKIKGVRARLFSQRHLELWGGSSGADRMGYRWWDAQVILRDIFDGLERDPEDA